MRWWLSDKTACTLELDTEQTLGRLMSAYPFGELEYSWQRRPTEKAQATLKSPQEVAAIRDDSRSFLEREECAEVGLAAACMTWQGPSKPN